MGGTLRLKVGPTNMLRRHQRFVIALAQIEWSPRRIQHGLQLLKPI